MRYLLLPLFFICHLASATPTQLGPTGAVTLPDAVCVTGFAAAADVIDNSNQRGRLLRVNYGNGNAEVGLLYGADDGATSGMNGKLLLTPRDAEYPVAIGAAFRDYPDFSERVAFVAIDHQFIPALKATAGVQHAQIHARTGDVYGTRGYLALTVSFKSGEEYCSEIQTLGDSLYESNFVASLRYTKHYRLYSYSVGSTNANGLLGGPNQNLYAGMSMEWR